MLINYDEYNKIKDELSQNKPSKEIKDIRRALGVLMSVDAGDYLISTKNIDKLPNISDETVYKYNQALFKDLKNSYKEVKKAIEILFDKGKQNLISDNPSIGNINVLISYDDTLKKDKVDIFSKESVEKILSMPRVFKDKWEEDKEVEVFNIKEDAKNIKDMITINLYNLFTTDIDDKYEIEEDDNFNWLLKTEGLLDSSKSYILKIDGAPMSIDNHANYKVSSRGYSTTYSIKKQYDEKVKLSSTIPYFYIDNFIKEKTNLPLIDFIKFTKKTGKFLYGYILNNPKIIVNNKNYFTNNEYNGKIQLGRELFEGFQDSFLQMSKIIQNGINTNSTGLEILNTIKENSNVDNVLIQLFYHKLKQELSENEASLDNTQKDTYEIIIQTFNKTYEKLAKDIADWRNKKNSYDDVLDNINSYEADNIFDVKNYINQLTYLEYNKQLLHKLTDTSIDNSNIQNMSDKDIEELIKNFVIHERATIFDNKVDSYILNFRDKDKPKYSDNVVKLMEKRPEFKDVVDKLEKSKYHDYFELDSEFVRKKDSIDYLNKFADALESIDIPVNQKTTLRWRKLGNYHASGIYFKSHTLIAEDFRYLRSYIHELTHHIDLSSQYNKMGRDKLVSMMRGYFHKRMKEDTSVRNIIEPKKDYYLSDTELIARGGEVAYLLMLGRYDEVKRDYNDGKINKDEFIQKLYDNFENNQYSFLMEKLLTYKNNPVYINIEDEIKNERFYILDSLYEYYKPFYKKDINTDIEKFLDNSLRTGFGDRRFEGVTFKPDYNFMYSNENFTLEEVKNIPFTKFYQEATFDFSKQGTVEKITLDDIIKGKRELSKENIDKLIEYGYSLEAIENKIDDNLENILFPVDDTTIKKVELLMKIFDSKDNERDNILASALVKLYIEDKISIEDLDKFNNERMSLEIFSTFYKSDPNEVALSKALEFMSKYDYDQLFKIKNIWEREIKNRIKELATKKLFLSSEKEIEELDFKKYDINILKDFFGEYGKYFFNIEGWIRETKNNKNMINALKNYQIFYKKINQLDEIPLDTKHKILYSMLSKISPKDVEKYKGEISVDIDMIKNINKIKISNKLDLKEIDKNLKNIMFYFDVVDKNKKLLSVQEKVELIMNTIDDETFSYMFLENFRNNIFNGLHIGKDNETVLYYLLKNIEKRLNRYDFSLEDLHFKTYKIQNNIKKFKEETNNIENIDSNEDSEEEIFFMPADVISANNLFNTLSKDSKFWSNINVDFLDEARRIAVKNGAIKKFLDFIFLYPNKDEFYLLNATSQVLSLIEDYAKGKIDLSLEEQNLIKDFIKEKLRDESYDFVFYDANEGKYYRFEYDDDFYTKDKIDSATENTFKILVDNFKRDDYRKEIIEAFKTDDPIKIKEFYDLLSDNVNKFDINYTETCYCYEKFLDGYKIFFASLFLSREYQEFDKDLKELKKRVYKIRKHLKDVIKDIDYYIDDRNKDFKPYYLKYFNIYGVLSIDKYTIKEKNIFDKTIEKINKWKDIYEVAGKKEFVDSFKSLIDELENKNSIFVQSDKFNSVNISKKDLHIEKIKDTSYDKFITMFMIVDSLKSHFASKNNLQMVDLLDKLDAKNFSTFSNFQKIEYSEKIKENIDKVANILEKILEVLDKKGIKISYNDYSKHYGRKSQKYFNFFSNRAFLDVTSAILESRKEEKVDKKITKNNSLNLSC